MAYTVKITYTPPVAPEERDPLSICPVFNPDNSYVDSQAYTEGHEEDYGKSVFATNIKGWGSHEVPEPYASTGFPMTVPMAQFHAAVVGDSNVVEFEVEDHKEGLMYKTFGAQLADQGFKVEVTKK